MALTNFSLPFGGALAPYGGTPNWATTANPIDNRATNLNSLLYSPEGHQAVDHTTPYQRNDPYAPPPHIHHQQPPQQQQQQRQQQPHNYQPQYRSRNHYLPPVLGTLNQQSSPQNQHQPQQFPQQQQQQQHQQYEQQQQQEPQSPQSEIQPPPSPNDYQRHLQSHSNYHSHIKTQTYSTNSFVSTSNYYDPGSFNSSEVPLRPGLAYLPEAPVSQPLTDGQAKASNAGFPLERPVYTQVQAGQGSKTQVHAVLDYDDDDYYDPANPDPKNPVSDVGPIFVRNDSVPVIPLYSYPTMSNGTLVQIPIWWTALSVALGLEVRGDIIKGTPCIKRHNQLFCPTAGSTYPTERIEVFIDDNKALMRRMYGDFSTPKETPKRKRDTADYEGMPGVPDITAPYEDIVNLAKGYGSQVGDSYFAKWRTRRQANKAKKPTSAKPSGELNPTSEPVSDRVDACESKIEIVTPYWASNSAGKVRAIVNTQHVEQAIHQEVCTKTQTSRCGGDCGCEQKYKWHRLLAYDPDNDCKGIFMDWFLFPSCCVCRCNP